MSNKKNIKKSNSDLELKEEEIQESEISEEEENEEEAEEVEETEDNNFDFYNNDDYLEKNRRINFNDLDNDIDNIEEAYKPKTDDNLEQNAEDYKKKIRKSGVLYISYIPEGMTISIIRKKLSDYGVKRVYLKPITGKKNNFKEGWIEFEDKLMAKLAEYELNGQPIGGKKRDSISYEIWTLKYLNKFKWHHLVEKLQLQQKTKEQELKTAISQAHRENQFIQETFNQSYNKKKKIENNPELKKEKEKQGELVMKKIKQLKPINNE